MSRLSWKWKKRSFVKIAERTYEKERKHYTAEEKVAILRRHLLDKVPVSDLCEEHGLQPSLFYCWPKELFENGAAAVQSKERPARQVDVVRRCVKCDGSWINVERGPKRGPHFRQQFFPDAKRSFLSPTGSSSNL